MNLQMMVVWTGITANPHTFIGLTAGDYDIQVRDASGCVSVLTVETVNEPAPVTHNASITNVTCNGGADGSIEVTAAGGDGSYEFVIDGVWTGITANPHTFSGLTAGDYGIQVRDGNGCVSLETTETVIEPDPIVVTLIDSLLSCGSLPVFEGDTLALPDAPGGIPISYESTLNFTEFDLGQTMNPGDIDNIFIDIEHTWVGDLTIELIAPDNSVTIINQQGGGKNLGYPVFNNNPGEAGDGYTYIFDDNASKAWTAVLGEFHYYNGNVDIDSSYVPAGTYIPINSLDNLVGTSMNGPWTLRVTDNVEFDNGFIFKWGIRFNESAYPSNYCNGMLEVAATGGNGGFTYEWSTGDNGAQATGLCADGYTVVVTDALGCKVEYTDSVYNVDMDLVVTDTTHVLCAGDLSGSATVSAIGGNAPYAFEWENGTTGANATGLSAGWHTITVTDFNSCEYVDSVEIRTIYDLDITFSDTIPISCNPANDGNHFGGVTANISGGTAPYTFNWSSTDGNTNVATNLVAGWNYITVSDANCSVTDSIFMDVPDTIRINEIAHQDVLCFGDSTGSTTITVDNGQAPLLVEWSHTADLDLYTLSDLAAGNYTVTVTDNFGCAEDTTITILQPVDSVTFDIVTINSSCSVDDGEATANITGGTAPYIVTWYDAALNPIGNGVTITGLGVGDYFASVEDVNLCTTSTKPFSVEHDTDLEITGIDEVSPVSCNGDCDGEYVVTYTGGTGPYTFNWYKSSDLVVPIVANDTATNLCGDTAYTIIIRDSEGCITSFDTVIPNPTLLTVDITDSTNVRCFGGNSGEATANADGGTPRYSYVWTDTDGDTVSLTRRASGLYADTVYTVVVTDERGCEATTTLTLSQPATAVTATFDVTNTDCDVDNGTVTINAVGGTPFTVGEAYEYLWESGATTATITDLGVGSYPFIVSDSLGCEYLDTAIVNSNSDLMISLDDVQETTCFDACDGSASITVTGGSGDFTYAWPGGIDIEDPVDTLCGGPNTVVVTDNVTGCQISLVVNVPFPAQLIVDDVVTTPALCAGDTTGTAAIVASGGTPFGGSSPYTYLWWDGATDSLRNDLAAGPYTVSVYDANNCETTYDFVITEPNPFSYDLDIDPADCGNDNGTITVSNINGGDGNYTVTWSHPDWTIDSVGLSITNLGSGNYIMTINDGNLCDTTQIVNLPDNSDLVVSLVDKFDPTCHDKCDGGATIEITGGAAPYTITWSNGATDVLSVNDLCDGEFTVLVTDINNCSFELIDSLQAPDSIMNTFVYTKPITCAGDSLADLYADVQGGTGDYNFIWTDTTGTVLSLDSSITNAVAGYRYYVAITDANSCETIDSVDIPAMPDSILMAFTTGQTNCPEDSTGWAAVDVTGGVGPYTFNWYKSGDLTFPIVGNDTDSASSLAFGYYIVEVSDMLGCTAIDSVIVQSNTTLAFDIEVLQEVTCDDNGSATVVDIVDGVGPFEYLWSSGETNDTAYALSVGPNTVMLTDLSNTCSVIVPFEMSDDNLFDVRVYELRPDYITGVNGNGKIALEATGGFEPYTYAWADEDGPIADTDSVINFLDQGWYYYTVTDALGCMKEDSAQIVETSIFIQDTIITNVSCYGYDNGAITIDPIGGVEPYMVTWRDVAGVWTVDSVGNTITNLVAGDYIVTIIDLFGGEYIDTLTVTQPQPYVYNLDNITPASCMGADGRIIIEVESGGTEPFTFTWEYNGYPELGAEGLAWAWPSDTVVVNDTVENLHVGNYYFTLVDDGGCTTVDSVFVSDTSSFKINPIALDPNCLSPDLDNGRISLMPENGADPIDYNWSHDASLESDIAANLTEGFYAVTLIDNDMCVRTDNFELTKPLPVLFDDVLVKNPQCSYDTTGTVTVFPLQGNGDFQYALYEPGDQIIYQQNPKFLNVGTGYYTVRLFDAESCFRDTLVAITSVTPEIIVNRFTETPGCPTDTTGKVRIEVTEGLPFIPEFTSLRYQWMIDSVTLDDWGAPENMYDSIISRDSVIYNVRPGKYVVRVEDKTGCVKVDTIPLISDTVFVDQFTAFNVNLVDTSIYGADAQLTSLDACKYDQVSLYASTVAFLGDNSGEVELDSVYWRSGTGLVGHGMSTIANTAFDTATVNLTGTNYYIARIEAGRCYMEDSVAVRIPDYPDVVASIDEDEYSQVFVNGRTILVTNNVTDSTYYSWTEYWEVTGEIPPVATLPSDADSTESTTVEVTLLQDSTIYTVIANTPAPYPVDDKFCTTIDTVKVRVMGEFDPPNAFSPNGDGTNDTWKLYGIDKNFSFSLKIYNRWGQLIFESTNAEEMLNDGWDGTNRNGNDVTIGTYYYVIEYSDGTKTRKSNGPVTVVR
jgi:gliding motility-associated-like protein